MSFKLFQCHSCLKKSFTFFEITKKNRYAFFCSSCFDINCGNSLRKDINKKLSSLRDRPYGSICLFCGETDFNRAIINCNVNDVNVGSFPLCNCCFDKEIGDNILILSNFL